ncbi:Lecithin:cholesterol acyltransferase-domain-containing protein [Cristinia sonorae]|uniref:Lecithin:cholesterol acyltransferase-domain-containing protein n=1 Tax=Cristinia sonorae TaxID=1940300 RepID=A0A8K0XNE4_9AGAR|nr:Lecithin:cholesterol acyltransferase-domain-containing protein [Cristinia sonorae]
MAESNLRKRHEAHPRQSSDSALVTSGRGRHDVTPVVESAKARKEFIQAVEDVKSGTNQKSGFFFSKRRFLFPLGIILGVLMGFILIQPTDLPDIQTHLTLLLDEFGISLPQLPQIDLSIVESEWRRLRNSIPEPWKLNNNGLEFKVGEDIAARGLGAKYPVVLVPGIISTGLESWSTSPEYRTFFRQKVWGGFPMISQVTFNREKWMASVMLDPETGLDPPGVKVRAAEGIDAASSFIQGYWLWSKIIENLAVVNYDTNNLHLAPYDWRLSYYNLEERDGYFSKLKTTIEGFRCGYPLFLPHYQILSFKWVESPLHGNGGPDWVEDNIEAFISVAGTHLGVAKAMAAFLSGEMKDTVQMNPAGAYVLERFFSRKERQKLFRSWAGSASMWLKGGDAVWGSQLGAPDDATNSTHSHGELIAFRQPALDDDKMTSNMTSDSAGNWILERTPNSFQRMVETNYSFGIERDEAQLKKNNLDHRKWTNPLEVQLPKAPSTKFYCVYGHGKDTERSYWYSRGEYEYDDVQPDSPTATCSNEAGNSSADCVSPHGTVDLPYFRKTFIDYEYTDDAANPRVVNGVKMGEGDGTVSLLSLGAMCVEGWKRKRWNPHGIKVTTVELPHRPVLTIPRGGGTTSDHVDILGSTALNEIILKVATGVGDEIQDQFVSNIRETHRQRTARNLAVPPTRPRRKQKQPSLKTSSKNVETRYVPDVFYAVELNVLTVSFPFCALSNEFTVGGASGNKFRMTMGLPTGAVLNCADNSGAKSLFLIEAYGTGARLNRLPDAGVGDMVVASVKKGKPELRKKTMPIVVVRQRKAWRRKDGVFLYFEDNAGVIVNPKGEMKGSAITGPVAKECADLWPRIASNAGTVV